jgi:hypothetical protein
MENQSMPPNLVTKPPAPPARSPERQALADAHVARAQSEIDLEEARRACARGRDAAAKTAIRLEAEHAAMASITAARARELEHAADVDAAPPPAMTGRARSRLLEAEDEHAAALSAFDALKARVAAAEDAHRGASIMCIACADHILRGLAKDALADAIDAARRLKKARLMMRCFCCPEKAGQVPHLGVQRGVFDDGTEFGGERAWRRANATKAAEAVRDKGFTEVGTAVENHLDRALQAIFVEGERQWSLDPQLAPWIAARAALIAGDADAALPEA